MLLSSNKFFDKEKSYCIRDNRLVRNAIKYKYLYIMLLPIVVQYFIFHYIPLYGITIAFKDYQITKGILKSPWIGFDNIMIMFTSREFWKIFKNTMLISIYKFISGVPGPIILALMLNEVKNRFFKRSVQTISYLPHFLSWVVLTGLFIEILSPTRGIVNMVIQKIGLEPIFFLGDARYFRFTLVTTAVWKNIGWGSIIYIAALGNIDPQLYDAAAIDGAGRFRKLINVTIPSLMPLIVIMLLLSVGRLIIDDFEQIFNLINPAVSNVGETLSIYTFEKGIKEMDYSFSSAVGLFTNSISFVLIILTNMFAKKYSDYGLW